MINKYEIIEVQNGFILRVMRAEYQRDYIFATLDDIIGQLKKEYPDKTILKSV